MTAKLHLQAISDLLKRYGRVIGLAWKHRKELESPERFRHESEFLPAALAIQETPVSPAPRVAMWLLMIFALFAVLWATFGRLDVVVTAQGKIVPNERVKVIQPLETAVVKVIHVTDGQEVEAGDVLIELDSTAPSADIIRLESDLITARLQVARADAFLDALDGEDRPKIKGPKGVKADRLWDEQRMLDGQWLEYKAKLDRLEADIARKDAEHRSVQKIVDKIEETLPIIRDRARVYKDLYERDVTSEQDYLEQKLKLIQQEGELKAQTAQLDATESALKEAKKQKEVHITETRRTILDSRHEAGQKVTMNSQELIKAQQRANLMKLCAPVDGTVQQVTCHTIGGVVTPAQQLMVIVPTDDPLEVEAFVENKDSGFVYAGQDAEIKIETFQFTKYGTIHARVKSVSDDAINDEKRGWVYSSRIQIEQCTVQVGEKTVNLSSGMAVTVEIKTGKRRVIEYFLTPLLTHTSESLRER